MKSKYFIVINLTILVSNAWMNSSLSPSILFPCPFIKVCYLFKLPNLLFSYFLLIGIGENGLGRSWILHFDFGNQIQMVDICVICLKSDFHRMAVARCIKPSQRCANNAIYEDLYHSLTYCTKEQADFFCSHHCLKRVIFLLIYITTSTFQKEKEKSELSIDTLCYLYIYQHTMINNAKSFQKSQVHKRVTCKVHCVDINSLYIVCSIISYVWFEVWSVSKFMSLPYHCNALCINANLRKWRIGLSSCKEYNCRAD